ncbi:MAG: MoaD/ThiS family protein [Methanobacteriaceae archaeon]|nr:MoaD/ThiS family protein [Methanobacteriaceae archaeon]
MKFTVIYNNERFNKESDGNLTIKDILDEMNLSSQTVISKKNGDVAIEETSIEDGDEIQFIQIIFGG